MKKTSKKSKLVYGIDYAGRLLVGTPEQLEKWTCLYNGYWKITKRDAIKKFGRESVFRAENGLDSNVVITGEL